jgi:hypothetical protein
MPKRIFAFIDSQNLNLGVSHDVYYKGRLTYKGWKLDFTKFFKYLKDKFRIEKAYLFIGYVDGNEKLYTKLQEDGYILVFKPTLEINEGNKRVIKGNVDAPEIGEGELLPLKESLHKLPPHRHWNFG